MPYSLRIRVCGQTAYICLYSSYHNGVLDASGTQRLDQVVVDVNNNNSTLYVINISNVIILMCYYM